MPKRPKGLDAAYDAVAGRAARLVPRRTLCLRRADRVLALEPSIAGLTDQQLRAQADEARVLFARGRETRPDVVRALAVIREVARRRVGMKPFRVQVAAALAMLDGCLCELATGEGKTLVSTMPGVIAGWRGRGCHIVTSNDYLAKRDAEQMRPVYAFLGLRIAHVEGQMEPGARRAAYAADVTTCTSKEAAADFLRDQLQLAGIKSLTPALLAKLNGPSESGRPAAGPDDLVQRGLYQAIVDEADSILIDEAVTPLIISQEAGGKEAAERFAVAQRLAERLEEGRDYRVDHTWREARLTKKGQQRLGEAARELGGEWRLARLREELASQALSAKHLFLRDKQYVVQDGKIVIVDESTGRLMPDRSWRHGLHQAVEAKEGVEITPEKITLARVSFQRFFRRYRRLCGMTGTAWEGRDEFWQIYKLPTVRIPTNKPRIRRQWPTGVHATQRAKWEAVAAQCRSLVEQGRSVLVGTKSVDATLQLSQILERMGQPHEVLNAVRHAEEAGIVSHAGQPGRVTISTNMAGRGTDIKLDADVKKAGGLHVICAELNDSSRVDRQLFGRAGRQGDPGSAVALAALDDELFVRHGSKMLRNLALGGGTELRGWRRLVAVAGIRMAQARAQRHALAQRKGVLRNDEWLEESLGFAGVEH